MHSSELNLALILRLEVETRTQSLLYNYRYRMMLIAIGRKGSLTVKTWRDQREKEKMWPKKRAVPCAATNAKIANCPSSFFGEERKGPLRGIIISCGKRKIDLCHLFQIKNSVAWFTIKVLHMFWKSFWKRNDVRLHWVDCIIWYHLDRAL